MDLDTRIKLAVYRHFAEMAARPTTAEVAARAGTDIEQVLEALPRLRAQRVLVLEADGTSIRMAPPFSGVPTQHVADVDGNRYFANCAWDVLGIAAALHRPATVHSSCAQSGDVAVYDVASRKEVKRIALDKEAVPGSEARVFSTQFGKSPVPVGLLIAPDGKRAWVASTNADVVSVIDLDRLEVVRRLTAGKEPDGLAGRFAR